MANVSWPSAIKPLTNKNYSTSRGGNVLATPLAGGVPIMALDTTLESPVFNLNFILSSSRYQMLMSFYDFTLNHGANSFKMQLDSGLGVEETQCYIVPGTWKVSKPSDGNWYLSVSMVAEVTSSQLLDSDILYQLFELYGDDVDKILNGLGDWVEAMPNE